MKRRLILVSAGAFVLAGAFGYSAYRLGISEGSRTAVTAGPSAAKTTGDAGKRVLYWHDPMVPGQKFDKPGKSPFMDMELVPVYADEAQQAGVAVSPGIQQNLGIRVAAARKGSLSRTLETVGNVAFNERDQVQVQARASGYVEKLLVRAPLEPVRKGQVLLQLYVPDWVAAQEEYLAIKRMPSGADTAGLLDAAQQRMRLAGIPEQQVAQVRRMSQVSSRIAVVAPVDGVVSELPVREGMTVAMGTPLFRINGLRTVWVNAEVPESAAAQVRPGLAVQATSPAFPGTEFDGKVEALLPDVNTATRTLKARIELANPGGKLVPGMFATIHMAPGPGRESVLVPTEAVIQTGTRTVVIVATGDNRFVPTEVVVGAEADGQTEIVKGLSEGQKVVASGQFLIDSEASLRGTLQRLGAATADQAKTAAPAQVPTYRTVGKVEQIAKDEVTISHGPIPDLKWGPMTMGFMTPASGMPKDIQVGSTVQFSIQAQDDGMYKIVSISRSDARGTVTGAAK